MTLPWWRFCFGVKYFINTTQTTAVDTNTFKLFSEGLAESTLTDKSKVSQKLILHNSSRIVHVATTLRMVSLELH